MCVTAVAWDCHTKYRLVAIANRDEFHERPAAALDRWGENAGIIAGRDLRGGGTWLGVSEMCRFALLTNFRDPDGFAEGRPTRGGVVTSLLRGERPAGIEAMNPFNAFYAANREARFLTNYPGRESHLLKSGIHGLSNGPFHHPWPKTRQLCDGLERWLREDGEDDETLFALLRAETPRPAPADHFHAPEPGYAPVFIRDPVYGTRCSTIVKVSHSGSGLILERSFNGDGMAVGNRCFAFQWPSTD